MIDLMQRCTGSDDNATSMVPTLSIGRPADSE